MLELVDIRCERAERTLFSELNLGLRPGELLEVRGANGAGKSTLLRIVAGLAENYEGAIKWNGTAIQDSRSEYAAENIYLGHLPAIKPSLSAPENLRWLTELKSPFDEGKARLALDRMAIGAFMDLPCYQLSAGQQRRVSLARLLTIKARLWVLDEPFTALDASGIELLEELLLEHLNDGGSVVLSTHQPLTRFADVRRLDL